MISFFKTIAKLSEGTFSDKGSRFPTYAFEVYDENDVKQRLSEIKELHPKATHHCYAYRLGLDKNNYRANDDGEPSGSAGRPILGQIDSAGMTNLLVIVVRYYGGTKLGVSGLINAYKKGTQDAINNATIIEREIMLFFEVKCDYLIVNDLLNFLKKNEVKKLEQKYDENCILTFQIGKSQADVVTSWLDNKSITYTKE
ncbi:MAG: IMPACT family protein [Chitinophagales bacterium]